MKTLTGAVASDWCVRALVSAPEVCWRAAGAREKEQKTEIVCVDRFWSRQTPNTWSLCDALLLGRRWSQNSSLCALAKPPRRVLCCAPAAAIIRSSRSGETWWAENVTRIFSAPTPHPPNPIQILHCHGWHFILDSSEAWQLKSPKKRPRHKTI